MTYDKSEQI